MLKSKVIGKLKTINGNEYGNGNYLPAILGKSHTLIEISYANTIASYKPFACQRASTCGCSLYGRGCLCVCGEIFACLTEHAQGESESGSGSWSGSGFAYASHIVCTLCILARNFVKFASNTFVAAAKNRCLFSAATTIMYVCVCVCACVCFLPALIAFYWIIHTIYS